MAGRLGLRLIALSLLLSTPAFAHNFAGGDELGFMIGGQAGLYQATPGGFKLFLEYGRRMSEQNWLNLQLNFVAGSRGCYSPGPPSQNRYYYPYYGYCGNWSGSTIELGVGVKMKFRTQHPHLVPYAKLGGAVDFIFFPYYSDKGIAPIFRGGGGVKYYVLPSLALGGEIVLGVGPLFLFASCGGNCSDVSAYVALDFALGLEWNF